VREPGVAGIALFILKKAKPAAFNQRLAYLKGDFFGLVTPRDFDILQANSNVSNRMALGDVSGTTQGIAYHGRFVIGIDAVKDGRYGGNEGGYWDGPPSLVLG